MPPCRTLIDAACVSCEMLPHVLQFVAVNEPAVVARSLALVTQCLADHGIWHCLAYGTLLGAVRDGDIIPWDHDFDLFARPTDARRILALNPELATHGLEIGRLRYPGSMLAMNPGAVAWFDQMHLQVRLDGTFIGDMFIPSLFSDGVLRIYDFETEVYWTPQFRSWLPSRRATISGMPWWSTRPATAGSIP
jgi:hypothetical protein